jgi:hypothetical protein
MLDPHPVIDLGLPDAPPTIYENVLFADNYYEEISGTFPQGQFVGDPLRVDAFNRTLTNLPGGYGDIGSGNHSDVHLWYHGTLNTDQNASDGTIVITDILRQSWYRPNEYQGVFAGFRFSRLGSRIPLFVPGGDGYYNRGDFNNSPSNRMPIQNRLPNQWANLITLKCNGNRTIAAGAPIPLDYVYQSVDQDCTVSVYLDPDQNPYNQNEVLVYSHLSNTRGLGTPTIDEFGNVPADTARRWYNLYGKVTTTPGPTPGQTRYFYADDQIYITTPSPPSSPPNAPTNLVAMAVSSTQINISWSDNSSNETSFVVERGPTNNGPWTSVRITGPNVQAYSDPGLTPATPYFYQVKAVNGSGPSEYSNIASATTQQQGGTTAVLTIASSNPSSGVPVASFVGTTNYQSGITPTSRTFCVGTSVGVTCPQTLTDGKIFQKWQLDGLDYNLATYVTVVMNTTHTLTAIYGTSAPPTRTLSSLAVEGPSSLDENSSAQYRARASYSDGSSTYVTASWSEDSNYATISSNGLLNAGSVAGDQNIEVRAEYSEGGVTRSKIKAVTIRNTNTVTGYTLNLSGVHGHITPSPDLGSYPSGTQVRLHAYPDDNYLFDDWSGDASGTNSTFYITMNGNKSVTANFIVDTSTGDLTVYIQPPQAVAEGAQWRLLYASTWNDSGTTSYSQYVGYHTVQFKPLPGWITPDSISALVIGGQTTVETGVYQEILGSVQAVINPPEAISAGAHWRLDGGSWQESGAALGNVAPGNHTVDFQPVGGWSPPSTQTVAVTRGNTNIINAAYGPPAGLPLITSISPQSGPIIGGTTVAIEGINFQAGATVAFGGVLATNVTLTGSTHITAITPARDHYGSVAVTVTVNGQSANVANGFAYLIPLGANMELAGQIGGSVNAVAVQGNFAYIGEGTSLVVLDFTNSAAPVERGRVALPAIVKDIAVAGTRAYVADSSSGLYVVDITTATSPVILGFYDTEGFADGVFIDGNQAYVADEIGLIILNVADPTAVTKLGSIGTSGAVQRVCAGTIGSDKFAFAAGSTAGVRVIKVTSPQSPVEVSSIPGSTSLGIQDVKLLGTTLYLADPHDGVRIFNISNPASPVQIGLFGNSAPNTLDVVGNRLYTCSGILRVADITNPSSPVELGSLDLGAFPQRTVVANGLAYVAFGRDGLKVASISNPSSMSVRSTVQGIGRAEEVYVKDSIAYVGGESTGLHTVDISNPARPVRLGFLPVGRVSDLVVTGGTAVLVNYGEAVKIANVSNPSAPILSATYTATKGFNIALLGSNPVIVGQTSGATYLPKLDILNVANPSSPQSIGSLSLDTIPGSAESVAVAGQWGFVVRPQQELDVVNLSSPTTPQKVGFLTTADPSRDVAATADGNHVFIANSDSQQNPGIQIVDTTTKTAPMLAGLIIPSQPLHGGVYSVFVSGDRLFAADPYFCYVYNISTPATPQEVAFYDIPGTGNGIDVVGDLVFVAAGDGGLSILRVKNITQPIVTITVPTANPSYSTTNSTIPLGGIASDDQGVVRVTWTNNRGGGGVASGTTSWQVSNVQLVAGQNVITVTAEDANNNLATDTLTVTASFADTTPPVINITGPRPDSQYSVNTSSITMSGTAADETAVASVTWSNDRGGGGTATGTTNWTVADLPLREGPNVITITAYDSAGNAGVKSQIITFAPDDTTPPSIEIDFPTINPTWTSSDSTLNISGTAADDRAVASITWENDRGGSGTASGSDTWFVNDIPLQTGNNVITVTAMDAAENVATDTLVVNRFPPQSNISGSISYCSNPVPGPVPNVTLNLTGDTTTSTLSDSSGNYQFSSLGSGGSYIVTPTKSALIPGSAGINTIDVIAVQRHFLNLGTPLSGCRLTAADVNGDTAINTIDVIGIQRFFLGLSTGIANTGKYKFTPVSRTYTGLVTNQIAQNYDTLVFGDVASGFVESVEGLSPTAAGNRTSADEGAATVAVVALPEIAIDQSMSDFNAAVTTSEIDAKNKVVGFQGDFTFDERVIVFQSEPVQKAGITGGNWNVSGNVLPGTGPMRTLRVSAFSNDFTPLSGSGTLFELRMTRVSPGALGTQLLWAAPPDDFIFIDSDLKTQKPGDAAPGSVGLALPKR